MDEMTADLSCLEFIHVSRAERLSTGWRNGVIFVDNSHLAGGCWSAAGVVEGFAGFQATVEIIFNPCVPADQIWSNSSFKDSLGGQQAWLEHVLNDKKSGRH